jgi:Luciferase-like monooxygenase
MAETPGGTAPLVSASGLGELAAVAEALGCEALWIATAPGAADPYTLAGVVARRGAIGLGIFETVGHGRLPAMVARDVTTLDVLSSGRARVLLADGTSDVDRLLEAATVCRLLFQMERPSFEGPYFTLHEAANLPRPVQRGGPPVWLVVPDEVSPARFVRALGPSDRPFEGLVVDGDPGRLAALREALGPEDPTILFWRGALALAVGDRSFVSVLIDAGADGALFDIGDLDHSELAAVLDPWRPAT